MSQYLKPQVPLEQGTNYVYPLTTVDQVIGSDGTTRLNNELDGIRDDIATIETSSTSAHSYVVRQYLVYNNQLYKVIAAIAVGDTLSVGTNIQSTTIANELKSLDDIVNVYYGAVALESGVTFPTDANYTAPAVSRTGTIVSIQVKVQLPSSFESNTNIFDIGQTYRPDGIRYLTAQRATNFYTCYINTTGHVRNIGTWEAGIYSIFGCYPVSSREE